MSIIVLSVIEGLLVGGSIINDSLVIKRNKIVINPYRPELTKITNRVGFIFNQEDPIVV